MVFTHLIYIYFVVMADVFTVAPLIEKGSNFSSFYNRRFIFRFLELEKYIIARL
jgi:hypothetical protein